MPVSPKFTSKDERHFQPIMIQVQFIQCEAAALTPLENMPALLYSISSQVFVQDLV